MTALRIHDFQLYLQLVTLLKQAVMEKSPQPCEPGDLHNPHSIKVYKLNVYYVKVVFPPICFALKKLHGSNSPLKKTLKKNI